MFGKLFGVGKDLLFLSRPNAWFVTVFSLSIGAVFALSNANTNLASLQSFVFLCIAFAPFIAGGLYVLNDVNDRKLDAQNPDKRNRPIAAGRITPKQGVVFAFTLLSIGLFLALSISLFHFLLALLLIFLQLIYSMPPIRLKESSIDFIFSGPLNHVIRFVAAWAVFQPLSSLPSVLLISLFLLYCVAYVYYKLIDKEFVSEKSIVRIKHIQRYLDFATVLGITLMFASILLKEVNFLFIACPTFLIILFSLQKIVPSPKRMPMLRNMFYGYAPFGLMLGTIGLWALIMLF